MLKVSQTYDISLAVLFLLFSFDSLGQESQSDWEKEFLRCGVKKILYCTYVSSNPVDLKVKQFNSDLYRLDSFSSNGYKMAIYEVENSKKRLLTNFEYKFDSNGNMAMKTAVDGETREKVVTLYRYAIDGKLIQKTINNNIWTTYTYQSGQLIRKVDSTFQGKHTTVYEYNDDGYVIAETSHFNSTQKSTILYTRDSQGNKTSEKWIGSESYEKFYYDENSNQILREFYFIDGTVYKCETNYSYDSHGNWVRRIDDTTDDFGVVGDGPGFRLDIRQIEYY